MPTCDTVQSYAAVTVNDQTCARRLVAFRKQTHPSKYKQYNLTKFQMCQPIKLLFRDVSIDGKAIEENKAMRNAEFQREMGAVGGGAGLRKDRRATGDGFPRYSWCWHSFKRVIL